MTVVFAVAGLIVGLLGVVLAVAAMSRSRRMVALTAKRIRSELAASGPLDPRAVRDVAVVRYDALEEMAGQLSFSVALLNSHGDGVVLTSINGRTETRTYAKVVADGKGVHQLSPEEQQAVRSAQLGHGPPTLLTQAPRLVGGHGPVRPATAADAERARTAGQRASYGPAQPDRTRPPATAPAAKTTPPASAARPPAGTGARPAATGTRPAGSAAAGTDRPSAGTGERPAAASSRPAAASTRPAGSAAGTDRPSTGAGAAAARPAAAKTAGTSTGSAGTSKRSAGTSNRPSEGAGSADGKPGASGVSTEAPDAKQEPSRKKNGRGDGNGADQTTGSAGTARGLPTEPANPRPGT